MIMVSVMMNFYEILMMIISKHCHNGEFLQATCKGVKSGTKKANAW